MRLALVVAVLLLPAAAAQVPLAPGDIEVEHVKHVPVVHPLESGVVMLDVRYVCRDYDGAMDDLRLVVDANATTRSGIDVPLDLVSPKMLMLEECRYFNADLYVDIEITFTAPAFEAEDIMDIHVSMQVQSTEGLLERGSGDPVTVSASIPMRLAEGPAEEHQVEVIELEARPHEASVEHAGEEYVPAAPLPLVAAGLALVSLLARRR